MISDRLNKRENEVMNAVFELSCGKERFLLAPCELKAMLPAKGKYDNAALDRLLRGLALDGYFELVESERKGEPVYVIQMREAGLSYRRQDYQRKRSMCFRLGLAVAGAAASFLVGALLRLLFQ